MLIAWDWGAHGIWWVLTREEKETPAPRGRRSGTGDTSDNPPDRPDRPRPWSDRLSGELLDDLQAWNDACAADNTSSPVQQERGRELAIRVQDELGTGDWEVLYELGDRMFRGHPPASWRAGSWQQDLLGYRHDPAAPDQAPGS